MRIVAQRPAGPVFGSGEMRVCAVVIALSECSNLGGLSSLSVFAANRRAKPKNTIDAGAPAPLVWKLDVAHTERQEVHFCVRRAHQPALVGTPSAKPTSPIRRKLHRPPTLR